MQNSSQTMFDEAMSESFNSQKKTFGKMVPPERLRLGNLPKDIKEQLDKLGISIYFSFSKFIENDDELMKELRHIVPEFDSYTEQMDYSNEKYNKFSLQRRNARVMSLAKAGFSGQYIKRIINSLSQRKKRSPLQNVRAINKIKQNFSNSPRELELETIEEENFVDSCVAMQWEIIGIIQEYKAPTGGFEDSIQELNLAILGFQIMQKYMDVQGRTSKYARGKKEEQTYYDFVE